MTEKNFLLKRGSSATLTFTHVKCSVGQGHEAPFCGLCSKQAFVDVLLLLTVAVTLSSFRRDYRPTKGEGGMSAMWSNQSSATPSVSGSVASTNDTEGLSPITSPCSTHVADSSASETEKASSGTMETGSTGSRGRYRYWGSLLPNSAGGMDCKLTKLTPTEGKSAVQAETSRPSRAAKPKQRKIFGTLRHLLPSSSPASVPNVSESQPRLSRTRPRISRRLVYLTVDPSFDESSASQPCSDRVENFHHALDNPLVDQYFRAFCKRTLSSENVAFVRQVCVCFAFFISRRSDSASAHVYALNNIRALSLGQE